MNELLCELWSRNRSVTCISIINLKLVGWFSGVCDSDCQARGCRFYSLLARIVLKWTWSFICSVYWWIYRVYFEVYKFFSLILQPHLCGLFRYMLPERVLQLLHNMGHAYMPPARLGRPVQVVKHHFSCV